MKAILFPGQGAQHPGMGKELFAKYPKLIAEADEILDFSVVDYCLKSTEDDMGKTLYNQPAIYVVNALSFAEHYQKKIRGNEIFLGHSLGEYNALLAAGFFDFSTGLELVKRRAELTNTRSNKGMVAVLGLTKKEVFNVLKENCFDDLFIANFNADLQFVVSGPLDSLRNAEQAFYENYAVNYVYLQVNDAFHSPYMEESAQKFKLFLNTVKFQTPSLSVIANISAKKYNCEQTVDNLSRHLCEPVRWSDSIKFVKNIGRYEFHGVGNSSSLMSMIKHIG